MSSNVSFPGARRSGMYVETDEQETVVERVAPTEQTPAPAEAEETAAVAVPSTAAVDSEDPVPVPAPKATPALTPTRGMESAPRQDPIEVDEDEDADPELPAQQGFNGFLNRVSGGLLKLSPSAVEAGERSASVDQERFKALIRQSSWTRAVGVLVANKKGTSGKTPLSITLGGTLASIRGGSVAIVEYADDKGQLAYRAEGNPQLGIGELVTNIANVRTQSQLRGYTVTQTSFASVIGSTAGWRSPLTRQNVLDVASIVDEHFTIRVMDTGNQYSSGPFSAAVEVADVLVVPTMLAQDAVSEAVELLEFLEHQGPDAARLAQTAIVVMMSDGRPEFKASKIKKQFTDKGIPEDHIYTVPFDSHIAERSALTLEKLAPATHRALTAISAGVIAQTNQNIFQKEHNR